MRIKVPKHIFEDTDLLPIYLDGVKQGWGKRGTCLELDNKEAQSILLDSKLTGSHGKKYGNFKEHVFNKGAERSRNNL